MIENCCNSCPTTQTVNTPGPQGDAGVDGVDGADGAPAFSIVAVDFTIAASIAVTVDSTAWMAVGQVVVVDGPAHFSVASVDSDTVVTLTQLNYPNDITGDISSGAIISPSGVMPEIVTTGMSAYSSVDDYTMTTSYALLNFASVDPTVTIATDGTYLVLARVTIRYDTTTIDAQTIYFKLYKNGTTDIASSETIVKLCNVTGFKGGQVILLPMMSINLNATDTVAIWGKLSASITGTIYATEADIIVLKIA